MDTISRTIAYKEFRHLLINYSDEKNVEFSTIRIQREKTYLKEKFLRLLNEWFSNQHFFKKKGIQINNLTGTHGYNSELTSRYIDWVASSFFNISSYTHNVRDYPSLLYDDEMYPEFHYEIHSESTDNKVTSDILRYMMDELSTINKYSTKKENKITFAVY